MNACQLRVFLSLMLIALWLSFSGCVIADDQEAQFDVIFGKATSTKTVHLEGLVTCQTINDKLVAVFGEGDNRELRVYTADLEKELWSVKFPVTFYNVSQGDHPAIVLVQIIDEVASNIRAYSIDGEFLFAIDTFPHGVILASPNGNYFYTGFSPEETNDLIIFDKNGNELLNYPGDSTHWLGACAFNDSIIALFAGVEVKFLTIPSGRLLKSIMVPVGPNREDKFPIGAEAKIARNGDHMIICWRHKIMYITPQLDIGWEMKSGPFYLNSAFSDDNNYIAIYQSPPTELCLFKLSSGELLWSHSVQTHSSVGTSMISDLIFAHGAVRILDPQTDYLMQGIINEATQSILFKYNPLNGAFVSTSAFSGVLLFSKSKNAYCALSIGTSHKMLILQEWKNEK